SAERVDGEKPAKFKVFDVGLTGGHEHSSPGRRQSGLSNETRALCQGGSTSSFSRRQEKRVRSVKIALRLSGQHDGWCRLCGLAQAVADTSLRRTANAFLTP
ncbi:MAG: hypothetical protein AAGI46_01210, partial [Planctomycetota bacterium]